MRIPFLIWSLLAIAGCSSPPPAPVQTGGAEECAIVARLEAQPAAIAQLDGLDPHSELGVLWADAQAGCPAGGAPASIEPAWKQAVVGGLVAALPKVLPLLLPLI
jgi:hypothetical protein